MWIIGVDGGGTKCEASIFTAHGELLATALAGPANLFADFPGAISAIEQACSILLEICCEQHNLNIQKQDCILSLGCAGGGIESVKTAFNLWPHNYAKALLSTDVETSCLAANAGHYCALFVIGTGSCLAVHADESGIKQLGGHGFLLGDIASGAWLGKQAVSWYLQALEVPKNDSVLQNELSSALGNSTTNIVQQYGHASAGVFGALAPNLIRIRDNSPSVQQWLHEGALYVSNLLSCHTSQKLPVFLTGGLSHIYKPLIEAQMNRGVDTPKNKPTYGAYLMARSVLDHISSH